MDSSPTQNILIIWQKTLALLLTLLVLFLNLHFVQPWYINSAFRPLKDVIYQPRASISIRLLPVALHSVTLGTSASFDPSFFVAFSGAVP